MVVSVSGLPVVSVLACSLALSTTHRRCTMVRAAGLDENGDYYDGVHGYPVTPPKSKGWHSQAGKIGAHSRWAREGAAL